MEIVISGRLFYGILFCVALTLTGCGKGETKLSTGLVHGKVTNKGKPVAKAQVSFVAAKGPQASGWTGDDGQFDLLLPSGENGAAIGESKVTVITGMPAPAAQTTPIPTDREVPAAPPPGPIARYVFANAVTVKAGDNDISLELDEAAKHDK